MQDSSFENVFVISKMRVTAGLHSVRPDPRRMVLTGLLPYNLTPSDFSEPKVWLCQLPVKEFMDIL